MNKLAQSVSIIFICIFANNIIAQSESTKSLIHETMLHPADAFTGYTFKKGEWAYNQAITPYPSWAWWGITDWLTTELDFEAWLGGVPSFNFKIAVLKQKGLQPTLAYETMYQYIKEEFDQFHNLDYLEINRQGNSWYNHVNASWEINDKGHLHFSGGLTYSQNIEFNNSDSINYTGKSFNNLVSADISIGADWRPKDWVSIHSTMS